MAQLVWSRRAGLAGLLAFSGCTLIDQRTFDPQAGMPPPRPKPPASPAPLAPPLPGPPSLLSFRLPAPADLAATLSRVVAAARARKADVVFDVVEITPDTSAGAEAAEVARLIVAQGVSPARVNLSARPIPGVAHEVRIFVR